MPEPTTGSAIARREFGSLAPSPVRAREDIRSACKIVHTGRAYDRSAVLKRHCAVPLLDSALGKPGVAPPYSPVMLWIDPLWDPIRHDPRFQALLKKYENYKPAGTTGAVAASTSIND